MEEPQDVGFRVLGDHRPTSTPRRWAARQSGCSTKSGAGHRWLPSRPSGEQRVAERATQNVAIRTFISVLSAGGDLQQDRFNDRLRLLRHRPMRNYLHEQVGQSLAIASLLGGLQTPSPMRQAISRTSPIQTGLPLLDGAVVAESTPSITPGAQQQLNTATRAIDDPKGL
jgi:hypothetical protein